MADDSKTASKGDRFTPDEVIAKQRNRQLFVLSGVIIVLAALVYLTTTFKDAESPLRDIPLVGGTLEDPAFARQDVKQIELWAGPQGDRLVISRDGKQWRVPSRFNAPADESDVDALLLQVFAAKRLNRASTETESQFVSYRLNDARAVHLRLTDDKGGELLHVMVGRSETGARDFVRLVDAEPGIFELTGAGGDFNTLYSTLNLDSEGVPQAKRWISTKGFQTLPFTAIAQSLTVKDGGGVLVFKRKQGADDADESWELTEPHVAAADGAEVRAVIDALVNYNASDIAGRDTDATRFGFMESGREIALTYSEESNIKTVRLFFGEQNDDNEVAVWLKTEDKGEYIYWAGDFILSRLFRPKADFVKKQRVSPYPDGAEIEHITILEDGATTELAREKQGSVVSWKMLQPWALPGAPFAINGLLAALSTLQGYRTDGNADYDALGVSPGVAARVITLSYVPPRRGDDHDGQDEPDPPETQPDQPPPDAEPKRETVTLYFGKTQQGEVPMLRVAVDKTELVWLGDSVLARMFRPAIEYAMPKPVKPVADDWTLSEVRRVNDGKVSRIVHKAVAEGGGKRWMLDEGDDMANQNEVSGLIRDLNGLEGISQATLDKQEFGLGEGVSTRMIDLRLTREDNSRVVSLYFGKTKWDRVSLMVATDGTEQFYLVSAPSVDALFSRVLKDYAVKVRHILISWNGKNPRVTPMDPDRTKEQATALANELLERFRNGEEFTELQKAYNDDSADPTAIYDVDPRAQLVPEFKELSSRLEVGEADIVESDYGYHIIMRIE